MANRGGIFKGTALGLLGAGSIECTGTTLFNAVKAALVAKGYTGLALKNSWDGCFQAAIVKELGHPMLTVGDVRTLTGSGCTKGYFDAGLNDMNPLVAGAGPTDVASCSDGSDVKGKLPTTIDPSGPLSTDCLGGCAKLPFLSADWQGCVTKCGGSILQPPAPTPGTPACAPGMFYDTNAASCMLMIDPLNCGSKCNQFPAFSSEWVQCMVNCGAKAVGPQGTPVVVPGTNPPVKTGMSMADVFGKNWLVIAAALAIGVGAVVYFNNKKRKERLGAVAAPNRRRRRRHHR
ncbi:MAG: hypothetical protein WC683_02450 [bacterium]